MIEFALVLYVAFLVVAFGWRSWIQYRRTGDHGFRGFSAEETPIERLAGLLFTAALFALLGAPIAVLLGHIRGAELPGWVSILGIVFAIAGFALVLVAQLEMGASWRIGVDRSERTDLVQDGLFALVRNPIFSAIGVFAVGYVLLVPNVLSVSGLTVGLIAIELQVRWIEEPYLLRTHGDAYAQYAQRVGRFVPGVGTFKGQRAGEDGTT